MKIKELPIYVLIERACHQQDLRDWEREMKKSYRKYKKKGLPEEDCMTRLDFQYTKVLLAMTEQQPQLFKDENTLNAIKAWMQTPESVINLNGGNNNE